jgi:hypothetical protein
MFGGDSKEAVTGVGKADRRHREEEILLRFGDLFWHY